MVQLKKLILNASIIPIAALIGFLLNGLLFEAYISVLLGLLLFPTIIFCFLKPKLPIVLLLLSTMFTEFYWMEVMGGYLKPFHIISIILFISFTIFHLRYLKHSKIFLYYLLFLFICTISIAFSVDWKDSLRSFILPLILFSISINIAIALYKAKINDETFMKIILYGGVVTVVFGIIQMTVYNYTGELLTFTEAHKGQLVIAKRPPSFFTEADTFGKFLSLPFLFFLPFAVDKNNMYHKRIKYTIFIFLLGIITNMTRSAFLGIGIAVMIYFIYLLKKQSIGRYIALIYIIVSLSIIIIPFFFEFTKTIGSHEELTYRIQTLINPSVMIERDQSVVYRKRGVEETFKGSVENLKAFLIGHGWGSAIYSTRGAPKDVGGTIFINILYYSGIFALLIYLLICSIIFRVLLKATQNAENIERGLFAEGILLTFMAMLIISQFASMWIAPEFWVVIGCAIYIELLNKQKRH